jgi:hypothetical protein
MGRADTPEDQRRPFYLYVDEFQNFATDSFAVILSQARKYALNLTVANQYISQMSQEVRDAVFGNVGTIISFRVSPDDSPFLQKYFEPQFESSDLIQQHNRHFVTSMSINGEKAPAFSAKTLNLPQVATDYSVQIIELSRQRYAQPKEVVEKIVRDFMDKAPGSNQVKAAPAQNALPTAKPKVQAQINHLNQYQAQESANKQPAQAVGKVISGLLKTVSGGSADGQSATMQVQEAPEDLEQPIKRKRTRRGGKKNRKKQAVQDTAPQATSREAQSQPAPKPVEPHSTPHQDEHVIHLR